MAYLIKAARHNPETGRTEDYWRIAERIRGVQQSRAVGFVSEREAKRLLTIYEGDRARGVEPLQASEPSSRPAPRAVPTVRDWWGVVAGDVWGASRMRDWIDARGMAPSTRATARAACLAIVRELGDERLDAVNPARGDAFVARLKARGLRSRTCQIYVDWLRRSLDIAVEDRVLVEAPKLHRPRDTDRRASKWLTPAQTAELLVELERRAAAGVCEQDAALAIRMQEAMLMRPGEVLSRRWEDLVRDRVWKGATFAIRAVELPDGTRWEPKRRRERTVAVPPALLAVLRDHWIRQGQPTGGWIFPQADRPAWPRTSFKKALAGACRAIGLPVLHPHALRHTGATRVALSKVERRTLMAIGGWETGEMLDEVYEHTSDARVAEVLAAAEVSPGASPPAEAPARGRKRRSGRNDRAG